MPGFIKTKKDEDLWERAKEAVSRNEHLPETKFKDNHWAMVNSIFHTMKGLPLNNNKNKEIK